MAKLIYTTGAVAVGLFLLFAFSHALISDVVDSTSDDKLPLTEAVNTLRLPSGRFGSESETNAEEEKLPEVQIGTFELNEENKVDESTTESVPLTFVNFRPAGRPFPLGHRRGCRHGHRNGNWGPRFHHGSEIEKDDARKTVTYGNDMIMSTGDEMKFDHHFHGGDRQIPVRWTGFRHVGPRFQHKHEMESERPHRHYRRHRHHDHDHDHDEEEEEEHKHGHHHDHGHGLFRSIRKFLNGF